MCYYIGKLPVITGKTAWNWRRAVLSADVGLLVKMDIKRISYLYIICVRGLDIQFVELWRQCHLWFDLGCIHVVRQSRLAVCHMIHKCFWNDVHHLPVFTIICMFRAGCLQCSDTCRLGIRNRVQPVKNRVRCCCCYLSGVRCKWFAHGPADATAAPLKSRMVWPFWCWLTQVVLEKRQLNGCMSVHRAELNSFVVGSQFVVRATMWCLL